MDITLHEFCSEAGITEAQFYGKEKINGSIDLRSLTSIPDGFNPTVGGELILYSLITIPDGFKFQATDKEGIYKGNIDEPMVLSWQNGRYRLIDGMFCEFISTHKGIIKAKSIRRKEIFYIVTDGVNFSHGKTIKEAQADLIYKISSRETQQNSKHGLLIL